MTRASKAETVSRKRVVALKDISRDIKENKILEEKGSWPTI